MSDQSTLDGDWLTVSQVSARLNLSEKTVRRRIKDGDIPAQKHALEGGGVQWRIAAPWLDQPGEMEHSLIVPGVETEPSNERDGSVPELQSIETERAGRGLERDGIEMDKARPIETEGSSTRAGSETEQTPQSPLVVPRDELVDELRDQVKFLRSALEARDRDAAELRAALRTALSMSQKALPESTLNVLPQNAPQRAEIVPMSQEALEPMAAQQSEPQREESTSKYFERSKGLRAWLLKILKG